MNEQEKMREYMVFSGNGSMGRERQKFYSC